MDQITAFFNLHGAAIASFCLPLLIAFVKSELMALNKTSAANGIAHYFVMANKALAIAQPVVKQPEAAAALAQVAEVIQEVQPGN